MNYNEDLIDAVKYYLNRMNFPISTTKEHANMFLDSMDNLMLSFLKKMFLAGDFDEFYSLLGYQLKEFNAENY